MKKFFIILMLLFCCSRVTAGSFNQIIFFGDSLTDNGNLYKILFNIVPKSPPYFKGRFSNGRVWSEEVGKYFYDKYYIDYQVYALGGATAVFHIPTDRFFSPANLELEVNSYLIDYFFADKNRSLFSLWMGGNDYLYYQEWEPNLLTDRVVGKMEWAIRELIQYGAQQFLVMNLPDLSKTPFARTNGSIPVLHLLTILHNQKLAAAVDSIKKDYPHVEIISFDVYELFNDVIANPTKYNEKYKINITNTTDACWKGGYLLKSSLKGDFNGKLRKMLIDKNGSVPKNVNVDVMSNMILNSPTLLHAYSVGTWFDQGFRSCSNASEYLFWDEMHPTEAIHRVLSKIIIERLAKR